MKKFTFVFSLILLTIVIAPNFNVAKAACNISSCDPCSCNIPGCGGNQLCDGIDEFTGKECTISQSCNVDTSKVLSCDCNGQVGNQYYTGATCGSSSTCTGEHGSNGTTRVCHYCVTPLTPAVSPASQSCVPPYCTAVYTTESNTVEVLQPSAACGTDYGKGSFLPNPIPPSISNWVSIKNDIKNTVIGKKNLVNDYGETDFQVYQEASRLYGLSCEILAGIHYVEPFVENKNHPNYGLRNGTPLSSHQADAEREGCPSQYQPGRAVWENGKCIYKSLLDSALDAARIYKSKVQQSQLSNGAGQAEATGIPRNFQEMVYGFAAYNGLGNSNCRSNYIKSVIRPVYCPPDFEGDDHVYPMSKFDQDHEKMYILYCGDGRPCNTPLEYPWSGAATVIRGLKDL